MGVLPDTRMTLNDMEPEVLPRLDGMNEPLLTMHLRMRHYA